MQKLTNYIFFLFECLRKHMCKLLHTGRERWRKRNVESMKR